MTGLECAFLHGVSFLDPFLHGSIVFGWITFVKDAIDKDAHSEDDSLLISRGILGEIKNKGISVGENFLSCVCVGNDSQKT
jgi:hypothetical protein